MTSRAYPCVFFGAVRRGLCMHGVGCRRSPAIGLRLLAALFVSSSGVARASAQDAGPNPGTSNGAVTVIARHIEESILDAPISISAVDATVLEDQGDSLAYLARLIPNLNFADDGLFGFGQLSIRGIYSSVGAATVVTYLDETPIHTRPLDFTGPIAVEPADLDRAEVSRGPQGTLFGASALGGVVRLRTRRPNLHDWSMRGRTFVEDTEGGDPSYGASLAAGGPLIEDRFGVRFAAVTRREGGFVDRAASDAGGVAGAAVNARRLGMLRGSATLRLGGLTVMASAHAQRVENDDLPLFQSSRGAFRQAFVVAQPGRDALFVGSLQTELDLGEVVIDTVASHLNRGYFQQSDYSTVFGELALGGDPPGLLPPGGTANRVDVDQRNGHLELRIRSNDYGAVFRWLAGIVSSRSRFHLLQRVVEPGIAQITRERLGLAVEDVFGTPLLPGGISYLGEEAVIEHELALFAEASWRLASAVELTAGLRLSRSRLSLSVASAGPYAGAAEPIREEGEQSETPVLPRLAAVWQIAPTLRVFAVTSRGYRVGGANAPVPLSPCREDLLAIGRDAAPADFRSDSVWNYEVGMKAAVPEMNLLATVSTFRIDWSSTQQAVRLPTCGFSFVDNLGDARSRGVEAEVEARPAPGLALRGAVSYADARFTRTIGGGAAPVVVTRGDRIPFTPRWSGSASIDYRWSVGSRASALLGAAYQYVGSVRRSVGPGATGYNAATFNAQGYGVGEFSLGALIDNWQLTASVDNLFDRRPILFSSGDLVPSTGSPLRQTSLRPRRIRLALTWTM